MSGSITQLSSIGKQDVDTVVRPTLTYFKSVFKKHTHFAMEPKLNEFQGTVAFDKRQTCIIPRQGDLIAKMYLYVKLGQLDTGLGGARYVEDVGRAMLESVELEIGSVIYDKLYPEYMHAWEELTTDRERQLGQLTGKSTSIPQLTAWAQAPFQHLYIPLNFFFHDDYGSALPLVALHLTDVKINVKTKSKDSIIVTTGAPYTPTAADASLEMAIFTEVIFLDEPERKYFAESELKYIISQVQFLGIHSVLANVRETRIDLTFNHPTKELIFMNRTDANTTAKNYFNFIGQETGEFANEAFKQLTLKLNNNNRFDPQYPVYFRVLHPKTFHTRIPDKWGIYNFSFALSPESMQASGSLNFSRIDTARFVVEFSAALPAGTSFFVFARNINVCSIASGVSLLRFAS